MNAAVLKMPEEPRKPIRDDPYNVEVIGGVKMMSPRPAPPHALVSSALGGLVWGRYDHRLGPPAGGPGGWWIIDEPELEFGDDSVIPDIAGWRIETMPDLPPEATFHTPPDWVCEVLSPSTEEFDRVEKLEFYGAHQVGHVWLAQPITRVLEIYRLQGTEYLRKSAYRGARIVRAEPFDALELNLGLIWPPLAHAG